MSTRPALSFHRAKKRPPFPKAAASLKLFPDSYAGGGVGGVGGFFSRCGARSTWVALCHARSFSGCARVFVLHDGVQFANVPSPTAGQSISTSRWSPSAAARPFAPLTDHFCAESSARLRSTRRAATSLTPTAEFSATPTRPVPLHNDAPLSRIHAVRMGSAPAPGAVADASSATSGAGTKSNSLVTADASRQTGEGAGLMHPRRVRSPTPTE